MRSRLVTASALFVAAAAIASCGGDSSAEPTLAPLITTTTIPTTTAPPTTVAPVTAPPAPTTSTTVPATTTSAPSGSTTTSSVPRSAALVLREDGLGDALFGTDAEQVIGYMTTILGEPTADSGWADPFESFGICPGTEVRGVTWGDLQLLFGDESVVASGRRHFFNYVYGPAYGAAISPNGLHTTSGIGIGSTVGELREAYPTVQVYPEEIYGPYFAVNDVFSGFLTGVEDDDTIISFIGGIGCGE
jgi:hypothetical protein